MVPEDAACLYLPPVCSVFERGYHAPRLIPITRLNLPSISRRRSLVPPPHRTRTAAHLRSRTRDGRKFTCAPRSDEHAAWNNASNFQAKHASVSLYSAPGRV